MYIMYFNIIICVIVKWIIDIFKKNVNLELKDDFIYIIFCFIGYFEIVWDIVIYILEKIIFENYY